MQRRSSSVATFALLGRAGNARLSLFIQRQATGQSQSGPTLEPVMPVLIGEAPQGTQETDQEQALLTVGAWSSAGPSRQGRRTATVGQTNGQPAKGEQMQRRDQRQRITM